MNIFHKGLFVGFGLLCLGSGAQAHELPGLPQRKENANRVDASNCSPASHSIDLNINNVRARILNGGDMWWDLSNTAKYEVPKVDPESGQTAANSLFAGAIWIGGIDQNNQLKVAAQTYRQTGNDYFPGPLDGPEGTTTNDVCNQFDTHWQVFGAEITEMRDLYDNLNPNGNEGNPIPVNQIKPNVLNWPAKSNPYNDVVGTRNLAPFYDRDGDGAYDPTNGDYPIIGQCNSNVYADQMIWWVYNDNGNIHSETGGVPIGMEVQALAFAFQSSNEINDMTFYKYRLYNKSTTTLNQCYMGQWVDPDLGNPTDDYIGCDTVKGLGIEYNADAYDEPGGSGGFYGNQPPLVGIDYFQGPLDQNGHELGMSYFLYYNNDFTVTGNPENTSDYYGYLSGKWKDGSPFVKGGTAFGPGTPTHYVFPSSPKDPNGWSECAENNTGADRRIVQSSGPFVLLPGASNDIIVGVVWVRPPVGTYSPCPSFDLLLRADDRAQALFNNCFKILEGPPPPTVRVVELNRKLVLAIEGYKNTEGYRQADPVLRQQNIADSLYTFEGYQIYQVKNASASLSDLTDPTKAQLIAQVDIKNGITKLVNYEFDAAIGADVPQLMVNGEDKGIRHTFEITTNAFATGDKNLINHQTYYFAVLPYAYNTFTTVDTTGAIVDTNHNVVYQTVTTTQKTPYLSSRSIRVVSGIPHLTQPEFGGLILNSDYGSGPEITRQEGKGNGGLSVQLTDASVNDILLNSFAPTPTYKAGQGPIGVKVYDPKNVVGADYELSLVYVDDVTNNVATVDTFLMDSLLNKDNAASTWDNDTVIDFNGRTFGDINYKSKWVLRQMNGDTVLAEKTIGEGNEQVLPDWGLSVYVQQVENPQNYSSNKDVIDWSLTFNRPDQAWLTGLQDLDADPYDNWIWSGTYHNEHPTPGDFNDQDDWHSGSPPNYEDPLQQYEDIAGRTFAPYRLASTSDKFGPGWKNNVYHLQIPMNKLPSVDLVFTSDTTKWSRCVVLETGPSSDVGQHEGGRYKMTMRAGRSKNRNGSLTSNDPNETGMSWFPGYAIDPETGIRLNVCFGEDSRLIQEHGRDMLWNPTSVKRTNNGEVVWGGRHYVYVLRTKYDSCKAIAAILKPITGTLSVANGGKVYTNFAWTGIPLLAEGFDSLSIAKGLIPTETTLRVRVNRAYQRMQAGPDENNTKPRYTFSTKGLAAVREDLATAKSALDTIKVVPNPYYAYSSYENSQVDNRVKIINLPQKCVISIYSLDGTLIRRFDRDDPTITSMEWDLKNTVGVPIASGIYIVHIDAEGIGEKTLKWFGVMRPIDLDSF